MISGDRCVCVTCFRFAQLGVKSPHVGMNWHLDLVAICPNS
jgi:hypothetical protein